MSFIDALKYETLLVSRANNEVVTVKLNRPKAANAINTQMGKDLLDVWTVLTSEAHLIRCAILTGAGEGAFCAGGDLKERNGMSDEAWLRQHEIFERAFAALQQCPVPVVAAVAGHAFAGGLEMALSCDFIYAERQARFAFTEVRLGIIPGCTGTQMLARAVGERRAKELITSAEPFSAEQALEWGMVNKLCEQGQALDAAIEAAGKIAENAPLAVKQAKKAIHYGLQMDLGSGRAFEIEAYNRLVLSEDRSEGVRAFNERRKPQFKGR